MNIVEWQEIIDGFMPHHEVEEIVETAAALRIPVSPVYDGETVRTNEHVAARGVFVEGPDGLPRPRRPYRFDGDPLPEPQASPRLGEHDGAIEGRPRPVPTEPDADPTALPLAGLGLTGRAMWRSSWFSRSSLCRRLCTKFQAPMFAGSSCTHQTCLAAG